jgi:hypothetical protein
VYVITYRQIRLYKILIPNRFDPRRGQKPRAWYSYQGHSKYLFADFVGCPASVCIQCVSRVWGLHSLTQHITPLLQLATINLFLLTGEKRLLVVFILL